MKIDQSIKFKSYNEFRVFYLHQFKSDCDSFQKSIISLQTFIFNLNSSFLTMKLNKANESTNVTPFVRLQLCEFRSFSLEISTNLNKCLSTCETCSFSFFLLYLEQFYINFIDAKRISLHIYMFDFQLLHGYFCKIVYSLLSNVGINDQQIKQIIFRQNVQSQQIKEESFLDGNRASNFESRNKMHGRFSCISHRLQKSLTNIRLRTKTDDQIIKKEHLQQYHEIKQTEQKRQEQKEQPQTLIQCQQTTLQTIQNNAMQKKSITPIISNSDNNFFNQFNSHSTFLNRNSNLLNESDESKLCTKMAQNMFNVVNFYIQFMNENAIQTDTKLHGMNSVLFKFDNIVAWIYAGGYSLRLSIVFEFVQKIVHCLDWTRKWRSIANATFISSCFEKYSLPTNIGNDNDKNNSENTITTNNNNNNNSNNNNINCSNNNSNNRDICNTQNVDFNTALVFAQSQFSNICFSDYLRQPVKGINTAEFLNSAEEWRLRLIPQMNINIIKNEMTLFIDTKHSTNSQIYLWCIDRYDNNVTNSIKSLLYSICCFWCGYVFEFARDLLGYSWNSYLCKLVQLADSTSGVQKRKRILLIEMENKMKINSFDFEKRQNLNDHWKYISIFRLKSKEKYLLLLEFL